MSDFSTLKQDLQNKNWERIAEDVIKYQYFKTSIAANKIRSNASYATKVNYINNGRRYLQTGKTFNGTPNVGPNLFKFIDLMQQKHIQPLTPKQNERYKETQRKKPNYTKKEATPPICELLTQRITSKIEYGVKYNDLIYLHNNEDNARIFLNGIMATGNKAEIVSVELGEIK